MGQNKMQMKAIQRGIGRPGVSAARLGDIALFLAWGTQGAYTAARAVRLAGSDDLLGAAHIGSVATVLFISASLFLTRRQPKWNNAGLRPKLIALLGTWSIIPLTALPLTWRPGWLLTAVTVGLIFAYALVVWALLSLRRNLSIFPEARELVRTGPYALVRHPLYSAHIACYVLICLPRLSVAAVIVSALGITGELLRARNEERVLRAAFVDYSEYVDSTPAFLPQMQARRLHISPRRAYLGHRV